ncbi:MAG TPA: TIR domain-containing protein [Albitalea sp.]|uniref:TIR domain-containing protein n=1 Tax=Piscinibacter sp. TaxID=1903157 RepID=UPI002ED42245
MRSYKLFISHAWHRDEEYERVVNMLNWDEQRFRWENLSVPVSDPIHVTSEDDLEKGLRDRMRSSCAFIACAGMYVPRSDWIVFEIQFARRIGRPIIMVPRWGQETLPQVLEPYSRACASRADSLIRAIQANALPEGQ